MRCTLLADEEAVGTVELHFRSYGPAGASLLVAAGALELLPAFARVHAPYAPDHLKPFAVTGRSSAHPGPGPAYELRDAGGAPVAVRTVYCVTQPDSPSRYGVLALFDVAQAPVPAVIRPPPRKPGESQPPEV